MMKKTIVLAVVAVLALGAVASATMIETTLPAGANLIAPPQVPLDSNPTNVFADASGNPLSIDGNLTRWDAVGQGYITYSSLFSGDFGGVLLGEGAWFTADTDTTWKYDAAPNGLQLAGETAMTDMWISLPTAGVTLFGNPFNSQIDWSTCMMTDGTKMLAVADAGEWFDGSCTGWDAAGQGYVTVGSGLFDAKTLEPWQGYWISTNVDNLALIVPAPAN